MATEKTTVEYIESKLSNDSRIRTKAMFGEYALYADDRVVGLICNDQLYLKILPVSAELEEECEKDSRYKGAKEQCVIEESQLDTIKNLKEIMFAIADALANKKDKVKWFEMVK